MSSKKLNLLGQLMLLLATLAWGTSFFILKETIDKKQYLSVAFVVAGIALLGISEIISA